VIEEKVVRICGFSVEELGTQYVRVDNITGEKRELSAGEGNLWADVWQAFRDNSVS